MAWSGCVSIANGIALWAAMAHWRGPEDVGQFTAVIGLHVIFSTICALGIGAYMTGEIARRRDRRAFAASATALISCWSIAIAVIMTAAGFASSQSPTVRLSVAILSLAMLPSGLVSIAESVFIALGRARVIAFATTTENFLRTLIPIFLLYSGYSLPVICVSLVVMRLTACAAYAIVARHQLVGLWSATWPLTREIAAQAPTFAAVNILAAIHWQIGSVLINRLGSHEAAAEYGVTSRFLVPAAVLLSSYAGVIQPVTARLAAQSIPGMGDFLSRCLRFVFAFALPFTVGGFLLGHELLALFFGARYASAWPALGLLLTSVIPFCLVMVVSRGLIATSRQRFDLLGNLVAVVVNVSLNFILIPRFGATGAAAAQLLSVSAMAAVEVHLGVRPLFPLKIWRAIRICAAPLLAMAIVLWLSQRSGLPLAVAVGGLTYLVGLAFIWERVRQPDTPGPGGAGKRRPRILMVGSHPTRTLGGIATTISNLLRSPLAREFEIRHIPSQADDCGKLGKIALALTALIKFTAMIVWLRPDLAYVHVGANVSLLRKVPFIAVARLLRRRVVTHFHAGDFDTFYQSRPRIGKAWIRSGIGLSHHLIAVSEQWRKWLGEFWPNTLVTFVPHGIKTEEFNREPEPGGSAVRLLFVGAMGRLKGERDLIYALQNISNVHPSLRLIMLGNGDDAVKHLLLGSKLHSLVEHLGPVALDQCPDFYKRADLFVLPTYAECLPISMLEAMAAGLPVISTTVGGIPDLIEDGVEGYLVAPGDIEALSDRIARLINNPAERRRMGERARIKALRYDEKLSLSQLSALLRQAARVPSAAVQTN
jgi:O-antigen/teichoic acid export membrane protein/glycosyltransferase involved in cell wall biosynthesis